VEKVVEQLPEPKKLADGTSITKRTSQIMYTAKAPLSAELRDALVLSVKLPDAAGKTLYFPTLQNCEQGQTDWSQIPADGQDEHSLKNPAPSVTITEALPAVDGHGAPAAVASGSLAGTAQAAAVSDDGAQARSWAGLVLGGLALVRGRRAKPAPAGGPAPKE
jgi:periplasmic copper chaperone A